ncbi:MAG: hypothetical protein P4L74_00305 [Candidatus Doudnabacteria bacterium]|nr:hypothetical protein [Candidatus Doudnabacteria bacterium]
MNLKKYFSFFGLTMSVPTLIYIFWYSIPEAVSAWPCKFKCEDGTYWVLFIVALVVLIVINKVSLAAVKETNNYHKTVYTIFVVALFLLTVLFDVFIFSGEGIH